MTDALLLAEGEPAASADKRGAARRPGAVLSRYRTASRWPCAHCAIDTAPMVGPARPQRSAYETGARYSTVAGVCLNGCAIGFAH